MREKNVCCVTVQHKCDHNINQYKYKLNYKSQEKGLIQVYHHNIGVHCKWNKSTIKGNIPTTLSTPKAPLLSNSEQGCLRWHVGLRGWVCTRREARPSGRRDSVPRRRESVRCAFAPRKVLSQVSPPGPPVFQPDLGK